MKRMKYISGSISSVALLLCILIRPVQVGAQDTLRTYGPRFGLDLARFLYVLADPSEVGAEFSVDFEAFRNIYPVLEAGYNTISEEGELFDYSAAGTYARAGLDYNILRNKDRTKHHSITFGFRYGMSVFKHNIENIQITSGYWGSYRPEAYENNLKGHWAELVGGMKTEVVPNLFLGWSVRVKFLLNEDMDPLMVPELIPGYGTGGESRLLGFSYSILYMIPLIKK